MVLLGFGLLTLLVLDSLDTHENVGYPVTPPRTGQGAVEGTGENTVEGTMQATAYFNAPLPSGWERSPLRDWPWAVLITVTLVGTVAWYARQARRDGGSVRAHVLLALGGAIAVPACYVITAISDTTDDPGGLTTAVGLPLLGLGALTGMWAYHRRSRTAATVSAAALIAGVGTILGTWSPGLLEPVLIAAGLLVLARYERSRLLVAVAGAVLVALVVSPDGAMSMLLPAAIVLAAAVLALMRRTPRLSG
ncbi:hypothetical protein GCM10027436_50460 [Actinophytocola sediminis]